ncbi:hypothetical protein EON65_58680 [archaeon]|nr:MAG: hypothetical protein EON65_58680 [archaeon]
MTSGFKSHTKRFNEGTIASEPGPGAYVPRSSLIKPVPVFAKPSSRVEAIPSRSPSPPSIPTRSQSHGYEVTKGGSIRPQPPAIPGYSGGCW